MNGSSESPRIAVAAPGTVNEQLASFHDLKRPEYVAAVKQLIAEQWQRIRLSQEERINEITGFDIAASLTGVVDALVAAMAARAFERAGAPEDCWQRVGVYALGSYGRGELSPSSDIDLLVFDAGRGSRPDWLTNGNQELQLLLWDSGFKVGASMRQGNELERIIAEDFVTATAVLEQRMVLGSDSVDESFKAVRDHFRKKRARPFLRYKIDELMERRGESERSLFKLEPNLKLDPGGMRDVQLLRNISYILFGSRNLHALRELDVITWEDVQGLFAANDHFLGTRSLLHFHHGNGQDIMRLTDQLWLADMLGYTKGGRLMAVEHMMRLHYQKTVHVHHMVELVRHRLDALGHTGRRRILIKTRRKIDQHFVAIDGRTYLADRNFWNEPDAALKLFEMCRTTQQRKLRISLELQRDIASYTYRLQIPEVREDHRIARVLLDIMGNIGQVKPILEDMHACGMLGAYLPEWGRLTCHMQFNSYHQYTVDHHTLIAIGYLDDVWNGDKPGLAGMPRMLRDNQRNDLLMLSLLLHDMGKFMGSGHVRRGALMVHEIAQRMGLDEIEHDIVHFLVNEHVSLSDATRSRDIHDPSFLSELASNLSEQFKLDMLYCLTYADARAVGEGVVTNWQEAILEELHQTLTNEIRWMTGVEASSRPQQVRDELRGAGLDSDAINEWLNTLPEGYLYQVRPDEVPHHRQLVHEAMADNFAASLDQRKKSITVHLATKDRIRLLADVAAALTANGLAIADARSWVTTTGMCLQSMAVEPMSTSSVNDELWGKLKTDLKTVACGKVDTDRIVRRQKQRVILDAPADSGFQDVEVDIDQQSSDTATVVDIRVKDRPGLLHELCNAIFDNKCRIEYASIATYGDVARDAFYVHRDGEKLKPSAAAQLRDDLTARLLQYQTDEQSGPETGMISF